jgi:hypothetical protein
MPGYNSLLSIPIACSTIPMINDSTQTNHITNNFSGMCELPPFSTLQFDIPPEPEVQVRFKKCLKEEKHKIKIEKINHEIQRRQERFGKGGRIQAAHYDLLRNLLTNFIQQHHRLPSPNDTLHGYHIGDVYFKHKNQIHSENELRFKKLLGSDETINQIIGDDIRQTLSEKEKVAKQYFELRCQVLNEYCIEHQKVPPFCYTRRHDIEIGLWFQKQCFYLKKFEEHPTEKTDTPDRAVFSNYCKLAASPVCKKFIDSYLYDCIIME